VARLVEKYHDEEAPRGRRFRLFLGAYPGITNRSTDVVPTPYATHSAKRTRHETN